MGAPCSKMVERDVLVSEVRPERRPARAHREEAGCDDCGLPARPSRPFVCYVYAPS